MAGSTHASPTVEAQAPKAAAGAPAPLAPITAVAAAPRRRVSPWADAWRRFRRHRLALASIVILSVIIVLVVLGPFWWRVPINDIDFAATLAGPSWHHPFGTDDLGQDLLARVLYGGGISLGGGLPPLPGAGFVGPRRRPHRHAGRGLRRHRGRRALGNLARLGRRRTDVAHRSLSLLATAAAAAADHLPVSRRPEGGGRARGRRVRPHRCRDRRLPLDAGRTAGARAVLLPAREGVRRGGA